jgi:hypothetical protein
MPMTWTTGTAHKTAVPATAPRFNMSRRVMPLFASIAPTQNLLIDEAVKTSDV